MPSCLCVVIQDAIENVQVSLLFDHAFLDPTQALTCVHDALITAAYAQYSPAASSIHCHGRIYFGP